MRITIINQFYTPDISPTANLAASLAEHLADQGHEVTIVASRGGYVGGPADQTTGSESDVQHRDRSAPSAHAVRVHRIWTPMLGKANILRRCIDYSFFYIGALWRLLILPRQDIVLSLTTPPYIALTGMAHKFLHRSTKLVLWSMDCYPDAAERMNVIRKGGVLSRIMRWLNRRLFKRLDYLICLDRAMVDLLMSQYAAQDRHLPSTVIPNWEPIAFFPGQEQPETWEKAAACGLNERFVVLYLGNMGYGHEFDTIIEAAEQLRDQPVVFVFVGGGKRWSELQQASRDRGLDNIIMHEYVDTKEETRRIMASADCALITLRDNSLGVMSPSKLHANLAMNLPVIYIGPEGSNVDDAITTFECGVRFRIGDSDGVVRFIRNNMSRPSEFLRLRENARQAFEQAYCDSQTLPQFDRLFESLVSHSECSASQDQHRRARSEHVAVDVESADGDRAGADDEVRSASSDDAEKRALNRSSPHNSDTIRTGT